MGLRIILGAASRSPGAKTDVVYVGQSGADADAAKKESKHRFFFEMHNPLGFWKHNSNSPEAIAAQTEAQKAKKKADAEEAKKREADEQAKKDAEAAAAKAEKAKREKAKADSIARNLATRNTLAALKGQPLTERAK